MGYGMDFNDIMKMTVNQFFFELTGYIQRDHREWERMRLQTYYICLSMGADLKSPKQIVTTLFDKVDIDADDIREWGSMMAKRMGWVVHKNKG